MSQNNNSMALLLCGKHFSLQYKRQNKIGIDFRKYVGNIQSRIIDFFSRQQYKIDIFISTDCSDMLTELLCTYKPVCHNVNGSNKVQKMLAGIKMIEDYTVVKYDTVVISRFDIYYKEDFINIDYDKLNIISILEQPWFCDDNFFLMPYSFLSDFKQIILQQKQYVSSQLYFHLLKNVFEKRLPVHYIKNEHVEVKCLTFFKLRYDFPFIINETIFTPNFTYTTEDGNSQLTITSKQNIYFKKLATKTPTPSSFHYKINSSGSYVFSYEIFLMRYILGGLKYVSINDKKYETSVVYTGMWAPIKLVFHTYTDGSMITFSFDDYVDDVELMIQNLVLLKLK